MRRLGRALGIALCTLTATGGLAEDYRYDLDSRASDYAKGVFGSSPEYRPVPQLEFGRVGASVSSKLDCGSLDIHADVRAEFDELQKQIKALLPRGPEDAVRLASKAAMMSVCYAYPTVCAQLRNDFLSLQGNLNLRSQACRAIDGFIDSSAERGAKQLQAEAQANCVAEKMQRGNVTMLAATRECQSATGLALRDFRAGLEKRFVTKKQKVLEAIVNFAHERDPPTYRFMASVLGEIEVQEDGYWNPLFDGGLRRPHDLGQSFIASAQARACGGDLGAIVAKGEMASLRGSDLLDRSVVETIRRKLSRDDVDNLADLTGGDRRLACRALGRAVGQVAANSASSKSEALLAAGLLNTAIPDGLRAEFRSRGSAAFDALKKYLESEDIPTIDEVRLSIAELAKTSRARSRMIASGLSESRLENERRESERSSDCVDTLSCSGRP